MVALIPQLPNTPPSPSHGEGQKTPKRTSVEVFETWQNLRANGFTLDSRSYENKAVICRCCGGEMYKGSRVYANADAKAYIHYYPETCQQIAAPFQCVYHPQSKPLPVRAQGTYTRLPRELQRKPLYLEVQENGWMKLPDLNSVWYGVRPAFVSTAAVWQRTTEPPITPKRPEKPLVGTASMLSAPVKIAGLLPAPKIAGLLPPPQAKDSSMWLGKCNADQRFKMDEYAALHFRSLYPDKITCEAEVARYLKEKALEHSQGRTSNHYDLTPLEAKAVILELAALLMAKDIVDKMRTKGVDPSYHAMAGEMAKDRLRHNPVA